MTPTPAPSREQELTAALEWLARQLHESYHANAAAATFRSCMRASCRRVAALVPVERVAGWWRWLSR